MEQGKEQEVDVTLEKDNSSSLPPTGFKVIVREFMKDKLALFFLGLFVVLLLTIFIGSFFLNEATVMKVSVLARYKAPGYNGLLLGTDGQGRDVFGQIILGARNSIVIGFTITMLTAIIGIFIGIATGYYGGKFDSFVMRIIDFIMILPTLMIIIVFVTIMPQYNIAHFIVIMTAFFWTGTARLIRSKVLSEGRLDYVSASKTLGSSDLHIMLREILPNLSSLIIVNLTLRFAGNIGIETGLTYLGFGFPNDVPSLGTLISAATTTDILVNKTWVWLPATLLIFVLMLCINYIGQTFQRVADAKQRLG